MYNYYHDRFNDNDQTTHSKPSHRSICMSSVQRLSLHTFPTHAAAVGYVTRQDINAGHSNSN